MEQYNVTGMSCAACSARIEKAVSGVDGVKSCSVSLLTNSMGVEGTASPEAVISAVRNAGYDASLKKNEARKSENEDALKDRETPKIRKRLWWSVGFLAVLMYFSMGHTMWNFPVPEFLKNSFIAEGLLQLLLTSAVMVINQRFFISGFKALLRRAPNMDTLVALGSSAAFAYSTYSLFRMTVTGENLMHELYFESAAMILTLIIVGKMLESHSKGKTTDALKGLMNLAPKTVAVERDGKETEVPVEQVRTGDIFIVRTGQTVPVDGVIIEGSCSVDESGLTGESISADRQTGDTVSASTVSCSGYVKCRATRVGEDTTLSQIIKMVSDAAATKAPIAKTADKVSGIFVPAVIGIAVLTSIIWLIAGQNAGFALARGISVLVISCPCALGLATPVAIMVGNGVGAKQGILFKTSASLEQAGKVRTVILDKTGTITQGNPVVTDIITADGVSENELMRAAYAVEAKSEHPLAKAVIQKAEELKTEKAESHGFITHTGNGVEAVVDGQRIVGGNAEFVRKSAPAESLSEKARELSENGKTPLWFASDGKLLGIIAAADVIKDDSPQAIRELKNMGIRVVMLTGDNEKTARAIGRQAGVDEIIAGVLPDGKEKAVTDYQNHGMTAMVGDGINDSPALTRADVGIAIGAGTDIAIDSADVVLMKSRLSDVPAAIRLSRAALKNIHENLFWAFFYNAVCIPTAAGVLIPSFGIKLSPMLAAAAMSLSSFCVVTNALRLNFKDIHSTKHDKKQTAREKKTMEKTVRIEGMMCPHCEARVKQTLEALPQVDEAAVSHKEGTAVLRLNSDISDSEIRNAVEGQGYKII